jgi:two-component sensor histidine kinase
MSFLLVIMFLTYRNMRKRTQAELEMKQKLEDLRGALDQKNNRIEEIHHRVKNNLQMISSMIGLQASQCEEPELAERMRRCRSRVHNIAMIHDLLNESVDEDQLKIKPYLERLIYKSIQMNYGDREGVDVHTEIDSMSVDAETATSCALIISELLTNCFQHAFEEPNEGRVDVRYERDNGSITLGVSDDGAGFPASVLDGSVDTTGHDIVRSIAESELGGEVSFQNSDTGAQVRIRFPVAERTASPEPVRP